MTPEQYRRAVTTALESRARADELAKRVKRLGTDDNEPLRQEAHRAWRAAQADERIVRMTPMEVIDESLRGATVLAIGTGKQLTVDHMCDVLEMRAAGHSINAIAEHMGRNTWALNRALSEWDKGTSRTARAAKKRGLWPTGRAA